MVWVCLEFSDMSKNLQMNHWVDFGGWKGPSVKTSCVFVFAVAEPTAPPPVLTPAPKLEAKKEPVDSQFELR